MRPPSSLLLAAAVAAAALTLLPLRRVFSQSAAVPVDRATVSLLVRFGVTDAQPRSWNGSVRAANGEIAAIRNWRPRPGDSIDGTSRWTLATRKGENFVRRAWEEEPDTPPSPFVEIPGLIVDVKAQPATTLEFSTPQGSFVISPRSIDPGRPASALGGSVIVDRVAAAARLSLDGAQSEFAALAAAGSDLWAAWIAWRDGKAEILARRFDGAAWSAPQPVTEKPGDLFQVRLAADASGALWAVWSEQAAGNWDLYARRFSKGAWSPAERLTSDPQPDIYPRLAAAPGGALWLVWQGFRSGKSDIFARRFDGAAWSPPERVSSSPANDWEPDVAAAPDGTVYVAWDTYDQGNYDVVLRSWSAGKWSEIRPVAATPRFEAHVSLACDARGRPWAVWNESGPHWGKDAGFLVKKEATRLYQSRAIGAAVLEGGQWLEPAASLDRSLPAALAGYNDFPAVTFDGAGRPWVFFRHRTAKFRDVHNNAPAHRAAWEWFGVFYDGGRWSAPVQAPFSQGRMDMRAAFALADGALWAAWATDNRDFQEYLFQRAEVYAARWPSPSGAPAGPILQARAPSTLTTFPVHPTEAADLARIRSYRIESGGAAYRILRGDTHRHTEFSMDGNNDGSLQQTYRYALDAADLDYLGVTDHNQLGGPDIPYINYLLQQAADVFFLPGRFTPLYSYERGVPYPNGHRNILFASRGTPTLPITDREQKGEDGAQMLYDYLRKNGGLAISHTSATTMGTDWRDNDPAVEPLVEIYQGDRVSAEYEGAPKAANAANPASAPGGFKPAGYVWNAWKKGYKLGVQSSSDHLSTHISYACTIARDFTRAGLLDAMRRRHSYGATDNIVLDYRLESGGASHLQGDIVDISGDFRLSVKILGTMPVRQVDVIRNDAFVHTRQPMQKEVSFTYTDVQPLQGESYYYIRLIQVDDQMAWSSPIWIKRR